MKVAVVGLGYVGLPLSLQFARSGATVLGLDIDRAKVLQDNLTPLARAVTKTYGIGGLKTAMEISGLVGGAVRAPLQRPDEAARAEIMRLLNDANDPIGLTASS